MLCCVALYESACFRDKQHVSCLPVKAIYIYIIFVSIRNTDHKFPQHTNPGSVTIRAIHEALSDFRIHLVIRFAKSTCDDAPQLLAHGLTFQAFHVEVIRLRWHDEENHHRHVTLMHLTDTQWQEWNDSTSFYALNIHWLIDFFISRILSVEVLGKN